MTVQDVADTGPVTAGESGLNLFLVAPLTGKSHPPRPAAATHPTEEDLMFFMTRSYQTLTYSDGGD